MLIPSAGHFGEMPDLLAACREANSGPGQKSIPHFQVSTQNFPGFDLKLLIVIMTKIKGLEALDMLADEYMANPYDKEPFLQGTFNFVISVSYCPFRNYQLLADFDRTYKAVWHKVRVR